MEESGAGNVVVDELPGLKLFSDGSFYRYELPNMSVPPSIQASLPEDRGIASKDVMVDRHLGLWVRMYLPLNAIADQQRQVQRLPVCLYFHGGGFCMGSASSKEIHTLCISIAAAAGAMVVSVNYRLAPEHRLPAAYDDCSAALSWFRSSGGGGEGEGEGEAWFQHHADMSKVFLMGDSAGGNIVHHVALREMSSGGEIRGLVMVQPSFAGEARTASEAESPEALKVSDMFRKVSLPVGVNRDHPFCNPMVMAPQLLRRATLPSTLLVVGGRDIRRDRQKEYNQALKSQGNEVRMVIMEEEDHAFYALKPDEKREGRGTLGIITGLNRTLKKLMARFSGPMLITCGMKASG